MKNKEKDQFIFESEKPNSHNELLKEISKGIKLKKTKTNDRSKPNLEGLRKFRRQMTIEEQVQKSMSQANLASSPSGAKLNLTQEASSTHVCIHTIHYLALEWALPVAISGTDTHWILMSLKYNYLLLAV